MSQKNLLLPAFIANVSIIGASVWLYLQISNFKEDRWREKWNFRKTTKPCPSTSNAKILGDIEKRSHQLRLKRVTQPQKWFYLVKATVWAPNGTGNALSGVG